MFGNLSKTLRSATLCMLSAGLILNTPRCFGLLPATGLFFRMLPLPTRILTTTIPCFALYPSLLALWILLGLSTRTRAFCFLHSTAFALSSGEFSFHILIQIWSCWLGILGTTDLPFIFC